MYTMHSAAKHIAIRAQVWSEALDLELKEEWEESEARLRSWTRYGRVLTRCECVWVLVWDEAGRRARHAYICGPGMDGWTRKCEYVWVSEWGKDGRRHA